MKKDELLDLELERKGYEFKRRMMLVISALSFLLPPVIFLILTLFFFKEVNYYSLIILVIYLPGILLMLKGRKYRVRIEKIIKDKFLNYKLREIAKEGYNFVDTNISVVKMENYNYFDRDYKMEISDQMVGKTGKIPFFFANLSVYKQVTGKNIRKRVFKGQWFSYTLDNNLSTKIEYIQKGMNSKKSHEWMTKVNSGSLLFDREFNSYCEDTKSFEKNFRFRRLEKIILLSENLESNISINFKNNEMVFLVDSGKEFFKFNINTSLYDEGLSKTYEKDINTILELHDSLKY